ncbi:MAG: hypothetical protein A2539_06735 [Elusimicrobia bacterium RIFOXYD2_FULL_34_15]|nr:MAG: hypothetical protein A2539_06735 [Elusimicrobia bacterium RIFOXYD2_FULL_34_15]
MYTGYFKTCKVSIIIFFIFFEFCTVLKAELISNGDFEIDSEGSQPSNWISYGLSTLPATNYITVEKSYTGTKSIKITDNNTTISYIYQISTVTAGNSYTLSAYIYNDDSNTSGSVSIYWYSSTIGTGSAISSVESSETTAGTSWQLISVNVNAPAIAQSCKAKINIKNTGGSTYFIFVDSVSFAESISSGSSAVFNNNGEIYGKITEIAPGIPNNDFLEIYTTAVSNNTSGVEIYEGTTKIKTFPSDIGTIPAGNFIVLWASKKNNLSGARGIDRDEIATEDANGNGYIDLFSDESSPGFTNTDNNFTLKNADGTMIDFVSFADNDINYSGSDTSYSDAVNISPAQWTIPSNESDTCYITDSFLWSGSTSKSIYRKSDNSQPKDTNAKYDWNESFITPGYADFGGVPAVTGKTLEVFQSPFSPYGDGTYNQAKISYNIPANYQATIRIFDITGKMIRILIDDIDSVGDSVTINWDGKDDDGNIVKIGIYLVHIEAVNKSTGKLKESTKRVVVARKL